MPKEISELRRRAEEENAKSQKNAEPLSPEEAQRVLHELRVHQIELEMQNEELRTSQVELDAARVRYFDLYDLAPVGYFTISEHSLILEANLTAAIMLDVHLGSLRGRPFSQFILKGDQSIYYLHSKQLVESGEMRALELRILKQDGSIFWAQLDVTVTEPPSTSYFDFAQYRAGQASDGASVIHVVISDISERKKAEEELLASEELAIKIMHLMPANIAVIDREGQIIAVNRGWTDFSRRNRPGEAQDDSLGSNYLDVCRQSVAAEDADALQALVGIEAVLAGVRGQFTQEYPCHCLNEKHWFLMSVVPLGVGGKGGAVIFHSDITERKLEEEKIKRTTTSLFLATQAGGVGLWDYDPVSKRLAWDEQMFILYGITSNRFRGVYDDWQEGVHPEDRRRGDDEIRLALSGEKEFNTEFRVLWPDGAVRNIRAKAIVQRDVAGKPLRMVGTNWDITVQKQAEAVLTSSKTKLELALQSAIMGVWQFNVVEDKRVFDNQVCSLLGLDPATFGGTTAELFAAVHPDDREKVQSALTQSIERDEPYAPEYRVVWKNGSIHHICARGRIIRDDMGRALMINGVIWDITERKEAEKVLQESQERSAQLDRQSVTFIWEVDVQGLYTYISDVSEAVLGYRPDEVVGRMHFYDFFPELERHELKTATLAVFGRKEPFQNFVNAVRNKDGRRVWVSTIGLPLLDDNGTLRGYRGSDTVITGRKLAEDALLQQKNLLSSIIESSSEAIYAKDMDGKYNAINETGARMLGYKTADVIGRTDSELLSSETAVEFRKTDEAVISSGRAYKREERAVIDGKLRTFLSHKTSWRDNSGKVVGVIGVSNDITKSKKAEEELRVSETKYRTLFETSHFAMMTLGPPSWNFISGNAAVVDLFRMTDEAELKCCQPWVLSPEQQPDGRASAEKGKEMIETAVRDGVHYFEWTHKRKDGEDFSATVLLSRVDLPGKMFLQATVTDITERKQAEAEKSKLELQLRESQKMEAVGQLAGGISHDFNNLLSAINGYSQMLLMNSGLKADTRSHVEEILRAGERAATLTRQLLLFSRHQPVDSRIIDLDAIISGMEKILRRLIREDIIINRKKGLSLWQIKADSGSIEQVIMNLAINAGDAMPDGGTLTIETGNVKIDETNRLDHNSAIKPGAYVMLSVRDIGCGMDEKVKEHIFESFFTTKAVGKGTGLSTVYGIVKQSDAYIDVQSELGKGTRFLIYFPQAVDECMSQEEQHEAESMPHGNETILLTEDDDVMRDMLQNFLQSIGYAVIPSCNGEEALEIIKKRKGQIPLLFTDVVMPGIKGFELAKQAIDLFPEIKVLFMSGYNSPTDINERMKTSGNFIQKPIALPALAVKLREILDAGKSEG
jgi:PAS domain S-box-containing protein